MPVTAKRIFQALILLITIYLIYVFYGFFRADIIHSEAIKYSKANNFTKSIELYNQVIKKNPSFIMARYFKANNYNDRWQNDDPQKAIETYNELWQLAPNYVQSKFLAGLVYSKLTMHFNNLANKYVKEHNEKAKQEAVLKRDECFKQAIKYFNQYKMIDPIFPYTYFQLANLYVHSGHPELAEKEFLEHINYPSKLQEKPHNFYTEDWKKRRMPEYSQSCLNLGSLELAMNKIDNAELIFIESLKYVPNNIDGLKNLATVYMKKQDKKKYNEIVKKLKILYPQDEYVKNLKENI